MELARRSAMLSKVCMLGFVQQARLMCAVIVQDVYIEVPI
jgi:hypothetical protein